VRLQPRQVRECLRPRHPPGPVPGPPHLPPKRPPHRRAAPPQGAARNLERSGPNLVNAGTVHNGPNPLIVAVDGAEEVGATGAATAAESERKSSMCPGGFLARAFVSSMVEPPAAAGVCPLGIVLTARWGGTGGCPRRVERIGRNVCGCDLAVARTRNRSTWCLHLINYLDLPVPRSHHSRALSAAARFANGLKAWLREEICLDGPWQRPIPLASPARRAAARAPDSGPRSSSREV